MTSPKQSYIGLSGSLSDGGMKLVYDPTSNNSTPSKYKVTADAGVEFNKQRYQTGVNNGGYYALLGSTHMYNTFPLATTKFVDYWPCACHEALPTAVGAHCITWKSTY
jgi:hypothetical protein